MGLYLRSSSLANPGNSITILPSALTYAEADGNFMYLLTNMSGSNIRITGSTSIVGTLTATGNITGTLIGTASWATNAVNATSATSASQAATASLANTASYVLNAVSSSFASTSSYVLNAISSSYALSASYAVNATSTSYASNAELLDGKNSTTFATTGSNTFIGNQIITGSLTVSGSSTFTNIGNTILTGSLYTSGSGRFTNDIISSGSLYVYNGDDPGTVNSVIYKTQIGLTDGIPYINGNTDTGALITWGLRIGEGESIMGFVRESGVNRIVIDGATRITTGGLIVTGSLNTSGSGRFTNGLTVTGSLNVSGSNTLIGTKIITGSVFISGSKTIIGTNTVTGSMLISGSTTQTGNNTLIGNTVLSGSINISGSQTFYGTSAFYGNHTLSGSNTITGNTVLSGSIEVSGSSNFRNSVFIVTGSSFFKGTHTVSGSTVVTGSFDVVDGNINIVSGSSFTRWGNKLFNYGGFSSTETQSGSANVSQSFTYNTTDTSNGVTFTSGSRIVLENIGIYNLQFSAQVVDTGAGNSTIHIWLKKNGSNVANTATRVFLTANQETVTAWNWIVTSTAPNDYYQIAWQTNDADTHILAATATGNFPAIPSVIITVTQVA